MGEIELGRAVVYS